MSEHATRHGTDSGSIFFDATLQPNRSLSPAGFRILMLIAGTSVLVIGVLFVVAGAWPVFGFSGVEFLLLYIAFRLNYRSGRAYERVRLTERRDERYFFSSGRRGSRSRRSSTSAQRRR